MLLYIRERKTGYSLFDWLVVGIYAIIVVASYFFFYDAEESSNIWSTSQLHLVNLINDGEVAEVVFYPEGRIVTTTIEGRTIEVEIASIPDIKVWLLANGVGQTRLNALQIVYYSPPPLLEVILVHLAHVILIVAVPAAIGFVLGRVYMRFSSRFKGWPRFDPRELWQGNKIIFGILLTLLLLAVIHYAPALAHEITLGILGPSQLVRPPELAQLVNTGQIDEMTVVYGMTIYSELEGVRTFTNKDPGLSVYRLLQDNGVREDRLATLTIHMDPSEGLGPFFNLLVITMLMALDLGIVLNQMTFNDA